MTTPKLDLTASADQVAAYSHLLWAGSEGWACLAVGGDGYLVGASHRYGSFEQQFFRWPREASRLTSFALEAAADHEVWVCPMLRSRTVRQIGTGIGGRYVWADLDQAPSGDQGRLIAYLLKHPGSFTVQSGSPGHLHLYIKLHEPESPEVIERLNRRLMATVDGDSKWDETTLLRLPGTLNHKARARGGVSTPVTLMRPAAS